MRGFFFSSRRRHTRSLCDWSSDVCSSDLGAAVLGNATFASQMGTTTSALLGGAVVLLSYGHLLWANAILSWIPVLLVLAITEPPASYEQIGRASCRERVQISAVGGASQQD